MQQIWHASMKLIELWKNFHPWNPTSKNFLSLVMIFPLSEFCHHVLIQKVKRSYILKWDTPLQFSYTFSSGLGFEKFLFTDMLKVEFKRFPTTILDTMVHYWRKLYVQLEKMERNDNYRVKIFLLSHCSHLYLST